MRPLLRLGLFGLAALCGPSACGQWSGGNDGGVGGNGSPSPTVGAQPNDAAPATTGNDTATNGADPVGNHAASPDQNTAASAQGNVETLHFLGRMDTNARLFTWPGNAVQATFAGTQGSATFQTNSGTNFVGVSIDGGASERVAIDGAATVHFGPVAQGNHTVRLSKLNESYQGTFTFKNLTVDGAVTPTAVPARRLEFVGASMTLGYGIDGTAPCSNGPDKENATESYSWLTAAALKADISIVAIAGYGLVRNSSGGSTTEFLPDIYKRTVATDTKTPWPFPTDQEPDAVVVNVGTNDFSSSGRSALDQNAFRAAYTSFAKTLRQQHPTAAIVLTGSPMLTDSTAEKQHTSLLNALFAVKQATADDHLFVLDFPIQSGDAACDGHPSRTQHEAMSVLLVAELQKDLGW